MVATATRELCASVSLDVLAAARCGFAVPPCHGGAAPAPSHGSAPTHTIPSNFTASCHRNFRTCKQRGVLARNRGGEAPAVDAWRRGETRGGGGGPKPTIGCFVSRNGKSG